MSKRKKIRLGIVYGGQSSEHEVSVISARCVCEALDYDKYEIQLIGISKEGQWLLAGNDRKHLVVAAVDASELQPLSLDYFGSGSLQETNVDAGGSLDVVFPVLHGPYGEDGTIQGLLEMAGIPYVGSGVVGSGVGMDKAVAKMVYKAEGVPQAEYLVVYVSEWQADSNATLERITNSLEFPIFVKPANMGSSVGVSKAKSVPELVAAMNLAARYDIKLVVEEGFENCHEIEVSVLGNENPQASVVGEIIPGGEFYDYKDKYIDGKSQVEIPANIPSHASEQVRDYAVRVFRAIDAAGLARVDFFVSKDDHQVYINEINTIPGFTPISMYPKLWEASGIGYSELIDRLIELALERHAMRSQIHTDN